MDFLKNINFNLILNLITICLLIFFIYKLIIEYLEYKEIKDDAVLASEDFDKLCIKYYDTELYKKYQLLSDADKEFLYLLISSNKLKHKEEKPNFLKTKSNLKSQLGYTILITLLLKKNMKSVLDALKFNTLFQFTSFYL
jgi:hypothetical protein